MPRPRPLSPILRGNPLFRQPKRDDPNFCGHDPLSEAEIIYVVDNSHVDYDYNHYHRGPDVDHGPSLGR